MSHRRKTTKASPSSTGDHLSALPDSVLQHALGLLEAREAVRTCVLARRWRHVWRLIPRLRITDVDAFWSVEKLNEFVDQLLLPRDRGSALDECEFDLRGFLRLEDARIDRWIRRVLKCHTRLLQVQLYTNLPATAEPFQSFVKLANRPLFSRHLWRLELNGLCLEGGLLDFSSCSVLKDLKITNGVVSTDQILSQSLKQLTIIGCELCWQFHPTLISAPSLISLQLDDYVGVTPVLESMPLLETATVNLGHQNEQYCDFCDKGGFGDCECGMCYMYPDNDCTPDVSVHLMGLSSATCLELIASSQMVTFRRDLRYCPAFSKLKSLLLSDWCLVADFQTLLYFLHYTPLLEKLTLQVCQKPKSNMELEGSDFLEQSLALKYLKTVEVKCQMIDEQIHNILKILSFSSKSLEKINVQKL
ncbi:MEIOTIC F-BOX protein MOF-like [Triticum dicoccoides]|uniref:MEIOTIC F-BOX protein MOF-like n=1 Tax=Triticum dicoccoides TaxID=85692 RepID=UPI00162D6AB5|nr:MEIOTIC F-BOX protein MOF-like [Triticum dicoccoides]